MGELQLWLGLVQVLGAAIGILYLALELTKMNQADAQKQREAHTQQVQSITAAQVEEKRILLELIKAMSSGNMQMAEKMAASLLEKLEQNGDGYETT